MVLSAILNLVFSIVFAKWFGIIGVQIGTIIGLIPILYGRSLIVVRDLFHESLLKYWGKKIILVIVLLSEMLLVQFLTKSIPTTILGLFLKSGIAIVSIFVINISIFYRTRAFADLTSYLKTSAQLVIEKIKEIKCKK